MNYRSEDETPVGAVIGGALGGLVLIIVIITVIVFFWRKFYLSANFKVLYIFDDNS